MKFSCRAGAGKKLLPSLPSSFYTRSLKQSALTLTTSVLSAFKCFDGDDKHGTQTLGHRKIIQCSLSGVSPCTWLRLPTPGHVI